MPYVIKHLSEDIYVSNSTSKNADYDENGLTSVKFARLYSSELGAKIALSKWARYSVSRIINQDKFNLANICYIKL